VHCPNLTILHLRGSYETQGRLLIDIFLGCKRLTFAYLRQAYRSWIGSQINDQFAQLADALEAGGLALTELSLHGEYVGGGPQQRARWAAIVERIRAKIKFQGPQVREPAALQLGGGFGGAIGLPIVMAADSENDDVDSDDDDDDDDSDDESDSDDSESVGDDDDSD